MDLREHRLTLTTAAALRFAHHRAPHYPAELGRLLAIPSVSADASRPIAMQRCAIQFAAALRRAGLSHLRLLRYGGPPVVIARSPHRPGRPHLLIYGHYDVQPAAEQGWKTDPFTPTVIGPRLIARGAADNKGPIFAHIAALHAMSQTSGGLPLNVTVLLDGEEEIGSPHLAALLHDQRGELHADVAVVSDTRILGLDRPAIIYALRGSVSLDLEVTGPPHALHAGTFGGAIHNPVHALADIISSLHDEIGRIAVPGLSANVRQISAAERNLLRRTGPTDRDIQLDAGGVPLWGPADLSAYERTTLRPAINVTSISTSGGQDLTAIPSSACARINLRLVSDQSPAHAVAALTMHVARATPATVRSRVRQRSATAPATTSLRHPMLRLASNAYTAGFGQPPTLMRSGGSIPAVSLIQQTLGTPVVLMGFTLPDAQIHGPNERLDLRLLRRAIDTCIDFAINLARACPAD
jgi:acetylornithine deacetylase/succinyl-diaminopimelate desuccinylase-like protein